MATVLYVNADPSTVAFGNSLGCGWVARVPLAFAAIASAPCVILAGEGQSVVIPDDGSLTPQRVAQALAPILAAEQADRDSTTAQTANQLTIQQKAQIALPANTAYLAIASPTNAQVTAQVKALTQQNNAIIRLALGLLDATT